MGYIIAIKNTALSFDKTIEHFPFWQPITVIFPFYTCFKVIFV